MLPSFQTERRVIRPRTMQDFESCLAMDIDPANIRSMRLAERIGLRFIGNGEYHGHPCKSYAMTQDDSAGLAERNL